MKLPTLTELNTSRDMVDVFKGYNHNLRIGDGEFYDMKNLTSDSYPVISPRKNRGEYKGTYNKVIVENDDGTTTESKGEYTLSNPRGIIQKDSLCYVDGTKFVINGYGVEMGLSTKEEDCPKTLLSMGAYVIIMPDKKWINTADLTKFGDIEAKFTTQTTVSFEMCKVDGVEYSDYYTYEPDITEEMKAGEVDIPLWLDTSTTPHSLKQYSLSNAMWSTIPTVYVKISSAGIGEAFEVNDGVTISGIEIEQLSDLNNTMIIWAKGDDYIVVTGVLDAVATQTAPITISRLMPKMDFIIESENRLWGCHYGVADNGEVVNEIYASKLGDFKNWHCFAGISTDSYAATVGTDGQFTGAVAHLGYPLFFKENYMHKVYGNYPANYQIQTITCRGVQQGSHKSLAVVNEVLYYKSRSGVCAYDGSLPQEISYQLGDVPYSNAVAGSHGNKYYISMYEGYVDANEATDENKWHLFVYDALKGMWHKEDNTRAYDFCSCRGELYFIEHTATDLYRIRTMFGSGEMDTRKVKWMAETGIIGLDSPDKKYVSKLNVRMSLGIGSRVVFYVQYDSNDQWEVVFRMSGTNLRSFTVPIRPKRCDHMRIRFEGQGECKIFSIIKTIEQGSDY